MVGTSEMVGKIRAAVDAREDGNLQIMARTDSAAQVKTRIVDTSCDWAKPIYVSKGDVLTDETAKSILAHNLAGAKQCGWRPSAGK